MSVTSRQMDELGQLPTIDLTTTGRRTGRPHRIEIWWFRVDGRFIVTGTPGIRDWLANVRVNPQVTVHAAGHDLPGTAVEITDPATRRSVMTAPETRWFTSQTDLDRLVAGSPMIEIQL